MPVVIKLKFPGGQYHATPWGRHVNEGVPEWPPSPWRLLRALIAVWKRTCPDLSEEQVKRILSALLKPPRFNLPPHRVAHTRHYMPWEKKGPADRTLVFDTFVSVSRCSSLFIGWPEAELSGDDRTALARLLGNLSSLGRAEGWVQAELFEGTVELTLGPATAEVSNPIPVFCPDPDTVFGDEHYPKCNPKKPADFLFNCPRWHLCLDTETIHQERWPSVPGARWVNYSRPEEESRVVARPAQLPKQQPTVVRFLLDGPVLPHVSDTVCVAEIFRRKCMSSFSVQHGPSCRSVSLSGKDAAGNPLHSHGHAHYLPTAEGGEPHRISHVTVYAPDGLGPKEIAAITTVRGIEIPAAGDQVLKLRTQIVGLGTVMMFQGHARLFDPSATWVSATPFVAHRHLKRRGVKKDTPHLPGKDLRTEFAQLTLRELIALRGIGTEVQITSLPALRCKVRAAEFVRRRSRPDDDGYERSFGTFQLTFPEPIYGPLCLGYACHFGLGLFVPPD